MDAAASGGKHSCRKAVRTGATAHPVETSSLWLNPVNRASQVLFSTADSWLKTAATAEEKTAGLEKEKAEKKAVAEDILDKLNAGANPEELAKEYKDDLYSSAVSTTRVGTSMQATVFADWALESGRKNGDTTLAEYQGGTVYNYYVVRFEGRALDESNTADVRHMLIAAETNDAVSVPTEEQFAEAEA